jgi:hypothetical protein
MENPIDYSPYYYFLSTWAQVIATILGIGSVFLLYFLQILNQSIITKSKQLFSLNISPFDKDLIEYVNDYKFAIDSESITELKLQYENIDKKYSIFINSFSEHEIEKARAIYLNISYSFISRKSAISSYFKSFYTGVGTIVLSTSVIFYMPRTGYFYNYIFSGITMILGALSLGCMFYVVRRSFK